MKSEEIIQRLLDEKRISISEAMVIMRDIINKEGTQYISTPFTSPTEPYVATLAPTPTTPYFSNPTATDDLIVSTNTYYKTE